MLHHPAFQSLVLPLLLALVGMAALRAWRGGRFALWGAVIGLLGAFAWLPGFQWPADARHLKLPWIVLAGLGVAVLAFARCGLRAKPVWVVCAAVLGWVAAGLWLAGGQASLPLLGAAGLVGWAVLQQGVWGWRDVAPSDVAVWAIVMVAAALGLAGLVAAGGSLLLAQLALMLATTVGAAGGWTCWRPSSGMVAAPWVFLTFGLAWLSLAWSWVLGAPAPAEAHAVRVAFVALAFLVPALLSRLCVSATAQRWRLPLAVLLAALLAALPVALAMAWPGNTATLRMPDTAVDPDDPYLTPSWR